MKYRGFDVSANISLLFADVPFLERPEAARRAGFDAVESWWPFATHNPDSAGIAQFTSAIAASGLALTGLNFWAGDMAGGERGVATDESRSGALEENFSVVTEIAQVTGCKAFNLLIGHVDQTNREKQLDIAADLVQRAAAAVGPIGGTVLIEPLATGLNGPYPFETLSDVAEFLDGRLSGVDNVKPLFDIFHLSSNGVDVAAAAKAWAPRIGHVQFADAPGRGEPGTGTAAITDTLDALRTAGYTGTVAAEYRPTAQTESTLGWSDSE